MEKKRSKGVTIIGWFELIAGLLGFISIALVIVVPLMAGYSFDRIMYGISNNIESVPIGIYLLVTGILTLKLRSSGRTMNLILGYLLLALVFGQLIKDIINRNFSFNSFLAFVIGIMLYSLFIYFFSRPKVKEQFK